MIDIDGTIDHTLAKGLRKRMDRAGYEATAAVRKRVEREAGVIYRKSGRRYLEAVERDIRQVAGPGLVHLVRTKKRLTAIMVELPYDGLYRVSLLDNTPRTGLCHQQIPLALSTHCVERFFERVRRPFEFSELAGIIRRVITQTTAVKDMEQADIYTEDGLWIFDPLDAGGMTFLTAKTFLHARTLSGERRKHWEEYYQ